MRVLSKMLLLGFLYSTGSLVAENTASNTALSLTQTSSLWHKGWYPDPGKRIVVQGIFGVDGLHDIATEDYNMALKNFEGWSQQERPLSVLKDGMWHLGKSGLYPMVIGTQTTLYCAWYYASVLATGSFGIANPFTVLTIPDED